MLNGLYKVEMHTVHGSRRGVIYVYDGKMMGGNSAFAFIGTYRESANGEVSVDISTMRHNDDPNFQPLLKSDKVTLSLRGRQQGEQYCFEGGTTQVPRIAFHSVMTPISEAAAPPAMPAGEGGIGNGLYSLHIRMLDGIDGGNTGVMVLHDGRIRGGDAFFDYIGAYTPQARVNARCLGVTKSASVFPVPTPPREQSRRQPPWPASAAFASARC